MKGKVNVYTEGDFMWLTPSTGHLGRDAPDVRNREITPILIGLTLLKTWDGHHPSRVHTPELYRTKCGL